MIKLPKSADGTPLHNCYVCKKAKPLEMFYREKCRKDGYGFLCRECAPAYRKNRYYKDIAERGQEIRERQHKTRKEWYRRNREAALASHRLLRIKNGKKWDEAARRKHMENPAVNMLANAKGRAKRYGLAFSLVLSDIVIPQVCPALGIPIIVSSGKCTANSPSLDRIDNSMGYVRGNVIVVSHRANTIKSDTSVDELRRVAEFYEHLACPTFQN